VTQLFQKKYRIKSSRLKGWDYSQDGYYFVTICTKDKEESFGKIRNKEIFLSPIGEIVAEEWGKTVEIRKNIKLDFWVVMPNHLHGILIINNWSESEFMRNKNVKTHCNASLRESINYKNKFGPQSNNLSSIIRGFKGAATKRIHNAGFIDFAWQPRFHDYIIQNDKEHGNIQDYILTNPANWEKDEENLKCKKCY